MIEELFKNYFEEEKSVRANLPHSLTCVESVATSALPFMKSVLYWFHRADRRSCRAGGCCRQSRRPRGVGDAQIQQGGWVSE